MSFHEELKKYSWTEIEGEIERRGASDVRAALDATTVGLDGVLSLLSPAADEYLEEMAARAHAVTRQRFGNTIGLFAPLYLSNVCVNSCAYCGFNSRNQIERLTLTPEQAQEEAEYIHGMGFRNILLVSGEAPKIVSMDYLSDVVKRIRPFFPSISVEIYPMGAEEYAGLAELGVDGLVVFQESYNETLYEQVHLGGKKRDFRWRLETPDRGGSAGFRRIGLGALLGLGDWRTEAFFLALHSQYLMRRFWKSQVSISFPRLRPAAGGFQPASPVSDRDFVQLLTALRLFLPDAGLTLSTREPAELRDNLIPLGISMMSAGSRTDPGGYTRAREAEAQFEIADRRTPEEVAGVIRQKGYEPVWKDWDQAFSS